MEKVITAQQVSKMYHIGRKRSGSLRETITDGMRNLLQGQGKNSADFWALKDISFEVNEGDVIGIIGKNGAGKSTLLKILSRITEPTTGRIVIKGRVSSLLEVGTGFHPELTGRENIFMNGAILGMKRAEIRSKFDEIVAFSGIEQFIDTPVKRYSSGMYVRLAFAVAAHLEPEILIVDEVLAVGDAEFQKKCLGKIKDVSESEGRTVLFVSHNMSAVNSLCSNCMLLRDGLLDRSGNVEEITAYYLKNVMPSGNEKIWSEKEINGDGVILPVSIRLINEASQKIDFIQISKPTGIEFTYQITKSGWKPIPNFHIFTANGEVAFVAVEPSKSLNFEPGTYRTVMWIPGNFLNEGYYTIGIATSTLNPTVVHFTDYQALSVEVIDNLEAITRNEFTGKIKGAVRPLLKWKTDKIA